MELSRGGSQSTLWPTGNMAIRKSMKRFLHRIKSIRTWLCDAPLKEMRLEKCHLSFNWKVMYEARKLSLQEVSNVICKCKRTTLGLSNIPCFLFNPQIPQVANLLPHLQCLLDSKQKAISQKSHSENNMLCCLAELISMCLLNYGLERHLNLMIWQPPKR